MSNGNVIGAGFMGFAQIGQTLIGQDTLSEMVIDLTGFPRATEWNLMRLTEVGEERFTEN